MWEKEKMLVISIFSFSHYVFYSVNDKFCHFNHLLYVVCKRFQCKNLLKGIELRDLQVIILLQILLQNGADPRIYASDTQTPDQVSLWHIDFHLSRIYYYHITNLVFNVIYPLRIFLSHTHVR